MSPIRGRGGKPSEGRQQRVDLPRQDKSGGRGRKAELPTSDRRRAGRSASGALPRRSAPLALSPAARRSRGLGGDQVEGRQAVRELLRAERRRVHEVWVADTVDESDIVQEILDRCQSQRVPLRRVGREQLEAGAQSDAPQGVLAKADPLPEAELEDLLAPVNGRRPFLLALDGVTDPHNLGALVRTGECGGVTGIVLPRHRSAHVTATVAKASAGAVEHVPMAVTAGLPTALKIAQDAGVWTVGLDPGGTSVVYDLAVADQPIVLVLGSEGSGLSPLVKKRCDVLAGIPQYGAVGSLNVSAAGAIAIFEIARQRGG